MIENRIGLIEMDYLEYPNFPSMPEDIKQEILRIVEETETESLDDLLINSTPEVIEWVKEAGNEAQESELGFTGQEVRKMFPGLVNYHFLDVSDKITEWVSTFVEEPVIHIQVMEKGTIVAPHIDEIRTSAYNYLLDTGGDASLHFYELINAEDEKWAQPQTFIPYDKINSVEETKIGTDVWHTLPTNKIHSVENIDINKQRISLTVSIV
tara:strand:- start:116 stop:745 length:630 start_codon:yes stop_codon:yes gene_type:complete